MTGVPDINNYAITIVLTHEDFRASMGRKAESQREFDNWAYLAEKGLLNGQIDWDILYGCTREAMEMQDKEGGSNGKENQGTNPVYAGGRQ